MSLPGIPLVVEEANSTVFNGSEMGSDTQNPSLEFSDVALIIPAVVFCILICVVIIYYLWMCWEEYAEGKKERKAAAAEASKAEVVVPIAEPEEFPPIIVVPADNDADLERGTDGDVEDAT